MYIYIYICIYTYTYIYIYIYTHNIYIYIRIRKATGAVDPGSLSPARLFRGCFVLSSPTPAVGFSSENGSLSPVFSAGAPF